MNIIIDNYVTLHQGVTSEEGEEIYNKIITPLKEGKHIYLDFYGMELMTTAFLNTAIGSLYKDFDEQTIKNHLILINFDDDTATRIKRVTTNAKSFYANQNEYQKSIEEIFE